MSKDNENIPPIQSDLPNNPMSGLDVLQQQLMQEVNEQTLASNFDIDAAEGLNNLPDTQINRAVTKLNKSLQKKVQKKPNRANAIASQPILYTVIILILILIIIAFVIIKKLQP